MDEKKTSIELCGERYMALYEQMMAPWRFEKWVNDLTWYDGFPLISVEPAKEE